MLAGRTCIALSLALMIPVFLSAQCIYRDTVVLEDLHANNFYLDIDGILNDDLADPDQGVCGVSIRFDHQRLGNILIELISPDGDMVALVGPTGNFGATFFTTWDVDFVPCGGMANPDAGFPAQWDSEAPWGLFSDYTGSYYPFNGCLETFDSGSANGTWTLHIEDNSQFDEGTFFEFSILFCDPAGISCQSCFSDAGNLPGGDEVICEQNTGQLTWPDPDYGNDQPPDSSLYGYRYVVSSKDSLIGIYTPVESIPIPDDTFSMCGLSYLYADSLAVDSIDSLENLSSLDSILSSVQPPFCGSLTENCKTYFISSPPEAGTDTMYLCSGDSLIIGDSVLTEIGGYDIGFPRDPGCDSMVHLTVLPLNLQAVIEEPDSLRCYRPELELDAGGSTLTDSTDIMWTSDGGSFLGDTDSLVVRIDAPGHYLLRLTDGSCVDSASVVVDYVDDAPEAMAMDDTIGCATDSILLIGQSSEPGSSFSWMGPGGFESNEQSPWVMQAGDYILTVTDSTGCRAIDTATVVSAGQLPRADISSETLDCTMDSVRLMVDDTAFVSSFSWSGPDGFSSGLLEPWVTESGWYDLHLSFSQQCNTTISYFLERDSVLPQYDLIGDTLNCRDTLAQLAVISSDSLTVEWTGPMGFNAMGTDIETNRAGLFFINITASNGCSVMDSIRVLEFIQPPTFSTLPETLGCRPDSALIQLTFLDPSSVDSFAWTGPDGFTSMEQSPYVTEEGVYRVDVIGTNGCRRIGVIPVERIEEPPSLVITADSLTCQVDSVTIQLNSNDTLDDVDWTGPGGFTSDLEDPVVREGGWYFVEATGGNQCTTNDSILIISKQDSIQTQLSISDISCQDSTITISAEVEPSGVAIQWSGPVPIGSDSSVISVTTPGWYVLTVVTNMGCIATDSIRVLDTLDEIQFDLRADTLNCLRSSVEIQVDTVLPSWQFSWSGPKGFSSQEVHPEVVNPGAYSVTVTDANGCRSEQTLDILIDTTSPLIVLEDDTTVMSCTQDTITLNAEGSDSGSDFQINWSSLEGDVIIGTDGLNPRVQAPGRYVIQIENKRNGCIERDTIEVNLESNDLISIVYTTVPIGCEGQPGGVIISDISGGEEPYDVFINESMTSLSFGDTIDVEDPGRNTLVVVDAAECRLDTVFDLDEIDPPQVDVGPDITIQSGEQIWISGELTGAIDPKDILWSPAGLSPVDSLAMQVAPEQTQTYELLVTDSRGCSASDILTVFVTESNGVYIPNTFTPNNDGINDIFYIQSASEVLQIRSMRIFNRWGDLVFEARNIPPNDPASGWNGRYNGRMMNPQVLVYLIEYLDEQGQIQRYRGDLTLIR